MFYLPIKYLNLRWNIFLQKLVSLSNFYLNLQKKYLNL